MKKILLMLMIIAAVAGCGKKEIKQVSDDSKAAQEAFTLVEKIRAAFVAKDAVALKNASTPKGLEDISANKKPYDEIELVFTPKWVELENDKTIMSVSWKSTWTAAGKKLQNRGVAVMELEGSPLKLSKITRGNPFIQPEQ